MTDVASVGLGGIMHSWDVEIMDLETGQRTTRRMNAMWDPQKDFVIELVARSAVGMANIETGHKHTVNGTPKYLGRFGKEPKLAVVPDELPIQ